MNPKTKYDEKIRDEICQLIAAGCLVKDVCAKVHINHDTYFAWLKRHEDFRDMIDKARGEANIGATVVLRRAMAPYDETTVTTKTHTETRLKKNKDGTQDPYTYTRTTQENSVTHHQGDWRAALEFLKRRDPNHWSERLLVVVEPEQAAMLDNAGVTPGIVWKTALALVQAALHNNMDADAMMQAIITELNNQPSMMLDAGSNHDEI